MHFAAIWAAMAPQPDPLVAAMRVVFWPHATVLVGMPHLGNAGEIGQSLPFPVLPPPDLAAATAACTAKDYPNYPHTATDSGLFHIAQDSFMYPAFNYTACAETCASGLAKGVDMF